MPSSCNTIHTWSPIIFNILFLESKSAVVKQFDHPLQLCRALGPSCPTSLKVKQFDFSLFKVLATRCDWGQQFDQLPLWCVEPLALPPLSESQPIWLCSLCDVPPVVTPTTPRSPIIFDILFLESKNGQTIWPSTSKSPWPCPTSLKVKQFDLRYWLPGVAEANNLTYFLSGV